MSSVREISRAFYVRNFSADINGRGLLSVVLALFSAGFVGCDQPFDPRGGLQEQVVVYSVLSTDRNVQFVRIETNYMAPEFSAYSSVSDNALRDAIVSIKAQNGLYIFKDTLLTREDTSRYKFPLHAYVLNPFTPQRGRPYQIVIQSASRGLLLADVLIPGQATIALTSEVVEVLGEPDKHSQDAPIIFTAQVSGDAMAYVARLFLYYDVLKGGAWVEERAEIPVRSADSSSYSLDFPFYPRLALCPSTGRIGLQYRNGYYKAIINRLNEQYRTTKLIFKWTTLTVLQADRNLFHYYNSTHPDLDPHSIRLDQPLISTVSGGLGMVGAYSLDSLVTLLPERFWGDR